MEATRSDFDNERDKRNNERDNLKTRNNYSLHMQEVVLCKKINQT